MSQQEQDKSQFFYRASAADFMKIPGSPLAYDMPKTLIEHFDKGTLKKTLFAKSGQNTGDNNRFLRLWYEVSLRNISFDTLDLDETEANGLKWYPYNKGGEYRKWYGNFDSVINWEGNGKEVKEYAVQRNQGKHWSRYIQNLDYMLREGITWTFISSSYFGARYTPSGHLFDYAGCSAFPIDSKDLNLYLGYFCSGVAEYILKFVNPTLNLQPGNVVSLPIPGLTKEKQVEVENIVKSLIQIARMDWDRFERSWNFSEPYLNSLQYATLRESYRELLNNLELELNEAVSNEKILREIFADAFNLKDFSDRNFPMSSVSLMQNILYRYSNIENGQFQYQSDTFTEIINYSIGCMMGRYSIDKPGLILASQGETLQDYLNQIPNPRFMPDSDAILPLTDQEWFADDVTNRVREFVKVVWGEETLAENLAFIAESLCLHAIKSKKGESAIDTIRRYLSNQFYKDHLKTYKKRPIYWLFSSGKEKAFECLVYLHRYNESTLARMRTEYVTPLMGKYDAQHSLLLEQKTDASPALQRELEKDIKTLEKKQTELRAFDEQLKHYADMRIKLDLDDGVKVNYGKFGNLLAEVKAVTGDKG